MKLLLALVFVLHSTVNVLVSGMPQPQGGYNYQQPSGPRPSYGPSSTPTKTQSANYYDPDGDGAADNAQFQRRPTSGGGGGGPLSVECQRQENGQGKYRFVCEGVNKDLITLKSEHVLWLQGPDGSSQVLDIEVPNYKIEELIKAGFKGGERGQGTQVNVLLKKPEQNYDAEADINVPPGQEPTVNLQYEPVGQPQLVHFPNDKPYRPLSGPILPPYRQ